MGYGDLLRDIRWQKRRLYMLEKRGWCCEYCCSVTETINVHHRKYRPGLMPWEYEDEELQVFYLFDLVNTMLAPVNNAPSCRFQTIQPVPPRNSRRSAGRRSCCSAMVFRCVSTMPP